ncbi:type IV secretory system conjugative DNA transfer family protein [Kitasatospora sp. NPDC008115]|uniref:type IV secretory system conjugative DNA transfer family protein n=1 Tax=Kitasatospora sp. NPDC008115 TaxID=3364022 RepID=UPI0036DFB796
MAHTHLVVGTTGSGKTHTLQQLAARATTDPTATTWAIEPRRDGLTTTADRCADFDGAEQMLDQVLDLARQRAAACVATGSTAHTPTEDQPRILLLIDEADHLLCRPRPAEQLQELIATGRALAIETAVAASTLRLDVWPLDLRDQLLAGDITVHGTPAHPVLPQLRERIADGTATVLPHATRTLTAHFGH